MIINKDLVPRIQALLDDYRRITENIMTDRRKYLTRLEQDQLMAIKKELTQMGLILVVKIPDSALPEELIVDVANPDPNMTPEQAKDYDRWFLESNGIKAD